MKEALLVLSFLFIWGIARNAGNGSGTGQVWMNKNLDTDKYRNGDPIPKVTDPEQWGKLTTGAYCYFDNDSAKYAAMYGKLYNWFAVNDPRGLAPKGWHVATDEEWTTMENSLGGGSLAGAAMKEAGIAHWITPNSGATNTSGFTALPGGYCNELGVSYDKGRFGFWWTATQADKKLAWYRTMYHFDSAVQRNSSSKRGGFSVRCIKD